MLHGNSRKKSDKIVSVQFMKKYIHIAKCIKPVLTEEASELLADEYANLRYVIITPNVCLFIIMLSLQSQ